MAEPFIGQIILFGGNFAPRGWAFCDGQLLAISTHSALFSILGTTFGGDGRTTFALPDLRGRVALHPGNGPGLSTRRLGQKSGSETNTMTIAEMPSHTHTAQVSNLDVGTLTATLRGNSGESDSQDPAGNALANSNRNTYLNAAPDQDMHAGSIQINSAGNGTGSVTVQNTGGNLPVNNMQPWLGVNYIIALVGLFPSRS